jgi:exosortase
VDRINSRNYLLVNSIPRAYIRWTSSLLVLFLPWLLLILHLRGFWSVDPQYSYGWIVPFVALFLFWRNWKIQSSDPVEPREWWALVGAIGAASVLGLVWLVHGAVPDWSVVNWSFALAVVTYQICLISFGWGTGVARDLLFPIAFILCAVPWPQRLELTLVQGLMRGIAAVAAEIVTWLDIPAFASGNVIRIPAGLVGIDEACSGVRSLQSMLMASLFLGELLRMKIWLRFILVIVGFLFALFFNLIRTVVLVWIANAHGFPALEKWHDPAGFTVLALSFVLLWIVAQSFRRGTEFREKHRILRQFEPFATSLLVGLTSWFLLCLVGTEIWYRQNETSVSRPQHLSVEWPKEGFPVEELPVSASAQRVLLYDSAKCAAWEDRQGVHWAFYSFVWDSGRTSTQSARIHRPENCLQGSGAVLQAELGPTTVELQGRPLLFRTYLFRRAGVPLYVFYLIWEQTNRDAATSTIRQDWSGWSRLQRVWLGQRNLGQQSLEIVLTGPASAADAAAALKEDLGKIVRIHS